MTRLKILLFVVAGLMSLRLIWALVSVYTELRAFKDDMLAQQALVLETVRKQEQQLNDVVMQETSSSIEQADAINSAYLALINEHGMLDHSDSGNQQVPAASNTAQSTRPKTPAKSPNTSQTDAIKLRQCQSRLLYEAKEYDILATHYNALLSIYKHAQGVINGNSTKDDFQGSRP